MKTALILCPCWSREMPHLAIALLSARLKSDGHDVFCLDLGNELFSGVAETDREIWKKEADYLWGQQDKVAAFVKQYDQLIDSYVSKVLAENPRIVGFSVYDATELMSIEVARRIKKQNERIFIVFGGPQCARDVKGNELIADSAVDAVVMGEGEQTLSELVKIFNEKHSVDYCVGALLKASGTVIDCGDRPPIGDLDSLPFPDFSNFKLSRYEMPTALPVLSSRGCINRCVFCSVKSYWVLYRSLSGERLFQTIAYLLEKHSTVSIFNFYDPLINGNVKHLERFCDLVIDNVGAGRMRRFTFRGNAVIHPAMTNDLMKKLARAGCVELMFGMESGSQRVVSAMGKNFQVDVAEQVIAAAHAAGIKVTLNFMFGFPTETRDDFKETLAFIRKNHIFIDEVIPSESFCCIDKKMPLYLRAEEFGIESHPNTSFWQTADGSNTFPERLRRFEDFCSCCVDAGVKVAHSSFNKIQSTKTRLLKEYTLYRKTKDKQTPDINAHDIANEPKRKSIIRFGWDICYTCNYRCAYCGVWNNASESDLHLAPHEWVEIWDRIYQQYGECHIFASGAEPTTYPGFFELIAHLSEKHTIEICTNLWWNIDELKGISPKRLRISPTYHYPFADFKGFLSRIQAAQDYISDGQVFYVVNPAEIDELKPRSDELKKLGLKLIPVPIRDSSAFTLSKRDEQLIRDISPYHGDTIEYQLKTFSPKGKLCRAGHQYAVIRSNGSVDRCSQYADGRIGNITQQGFSLSDESHQCDKDFCPIESQWIIK